MIPIELMMSPARAPAKYKAIVEGSFGIFGCDFIFPWYLLGGAETLCSRNHSTEYPWDMTLMDVLPQVKKLDHSELVELHRTIGSWLSEQERPINQEEIDAVQSRFHDYVLHPEDEITEDEMTRYLNDLVQ